MMCLQFVFESWNNIIKVLGILFDFSVFINGVMWVLVFFFFGGNFD